MKITADTVDLRVDYRAPGRVYSESLEGGHFDAGDRTTYPFDSEVVPAGTTWAPPAGAKVVRIVELGGAAEPGGTPE